jgi:hypothetical protein
MPRISVPLGVDAGRDQAVHVHGAAALADLLGQRVDPAERVRASVQRPVPEPFHHLVQLRGHHADLRLGQARHAQGGGQLFHPPGRDPQQVRRGHHRGQRPLGPAAVLQERREVRPVPQLRDRQLDRPRPGIPLPPPVPVPRVHPVRRHLPVPRVTPDLDVSVHHPLGELPDHLPQHIRARRCQGLLELRAANRHNVTYGHFALLRCHESTSKDREVAASHHDDTPD